MVLPNQVSNLDTSEIMQLASSGRAEELRDVLRSKCHAENGGLYYFSKVVLGYKEMVPHYHLPFGNKIQNTMVQRRRGFLRPRGHFKSSMAAKSYPLWRHTGGGKQIGDPPDPRNLRFLIAGESDTVACKDIKDPRWHLENNQLLRWLFPEIVPLDFNKVAWRDDAIEVQRSETFDEASITAIGVGAKGTGFHYDEIIYDDIIGEKAAKSVAVMTEAIEWFSYAGGYANDPGTFRELMIGTRWKHGKADIYGYIMEELVHNEEQGERASGFIWDVEGCRTPDGEIRFYPRFTEEILADLLKREKTYKFSCQYDNNPTAPPGTKFTEEMLKSFKIGIDPSDGKRDLIIPDDGTPPIKLKHLARLSFYDPSSGGKSAGSENAIVCMGCAPDGRKFAFKVWSANCGFRGAVEQWFLFNDQFSTWPNYFEGVGPHKEVASIVELRQQESVCRVCEKAGKKVKHHRLGPVLVLPPGGAGSKDDRILTFAQADIEDGLIYLHEGDSQTRAQIVSFPHGDLKDRFDALAYAIHYSKRPQSADEAEAEQHTRQQRDQAKVQRTSQTYDVGGYI